MLLGQDQRKESISNSHINRKSNLINLIKFKGDFESLLPFQGGEYLKKYNPEETKLFYFAVKNILEQNMNNPLIIKNDTISAKWNDLYSLAISELQNIGLKTGNYKQISMTNAQLQISSDSLSLERFQKRNLSNFVDNLYVFYFSFLEFFKSQR